METYDQFPINLLESQGSITIPSVKVLSDNVNIWENGGVVEHSVTPTSIILDTQSEGVSYIITNQKLGQFINLNGFFKEKSENKDRILLSTDLFAGGIGEYMCPDMLSLFYKQGKLAKLQFTITNPSRIVEFIIPIFDQIEVTPKEDDSYETKVKLWHLMCVIAISKANGIRNPTQRQLIETIMKRENMTEEHLNRVNNNATSISFMPPADDRKKLRILYDMVVIMIAGGQMTDEEKGLIGDIAYKFGFKPDKTLDYLMQTVFNEM